MQFHLKLVQVGDGNNELRAQNHYTALSLAQRPMEMLIADKEIAALKVASRTNPDGLSEADRERLEHYDFLLFNSWEFSFLQQQDGTIPQELWQGHDGWMRGQVETNPSFESSWRKLEHSFGTSFKQYVNDLYSDKKAGKGLLH